MQKNRIIAFVGMPGSGKGTCTDYLHQKYGYPVVHFGNMVYEEVQRRGLDNVKDEKFVREDMRAKEGPAVMAKHATLKARQHFEDGAETVVFDGLYSWSELKYLSEEFGDDALTIIAVAAPRQERYKRILSRNDAHRKYTSTDQIRDRDIAEIENLEKGGPIAFADYTLVNDESPEDMLRKLDAIIA